MADHQHDPLDVEALEHPLNHRQQRGDFGHIPFDGGNFAACMRELVNWFQRGYAWELRWAANAARFEAIVARLRADTLGEIFANDSRQKLYANLSKQLLQQMTLFEQMRPRAFLPQTLSA